MKKLEITNRRAKYEYHFIDEYQAGIVLMGSEVKTIKIGKVSIVDSFCYFKGDELFIKNFNVTEMSTSYTHEPNREKKLLLNKKELKKLKSDLTKGLTIIPYKVYTNDKGIIKVKIVLAKGKKDWDKRNDIKEKDIQRELKKTIF